MPTPSQPPATTAPTTPTTASTSNRIEVVCDTQGTLELRLALVETRGQPETRWRTLPMSRGSSGGTPGFVFGVDLAAQNPPLADGRYEYELVRDGDSSRPIADPYATELTRFGGYRGVLEMRNGQRHVAPFDWSDELDPARPLPSNRELVIYELPIRWMTDDSNALERQVGLGTFDKALFEVLPRLVELGVNAVELLPAQDSPDTLNWGYGTRFFFAPDYDLGTPLDLRCFVKRCHQLGLRVTLDVVMNHARQCPLERLAADWYFLGSPSEEQRGQDWGAKLFRFVKDDPPGRHLAREFLYAMARFWVAEYHVDGLRIDEFNGINHYDFVEDFTKAAWDEHDQRFPDRPFVVIAEDSARRADITKKLHRGDRVVDAMWDFNYRDELRRLLVNGLATSWGEPSRTERVTSALRGDRSWDDYPRQFGPGFDDPAQRVVYLTSHDIEKDWEQRILNFLLADELARRGWTDRGWQVLRNVVDEVPGYDHPDAKAAHAKALERVRSAFALLLTSVGMPMMLAGDEFGDVHDTDRSDWRQKMSDPVDWQRATRPLHAALKRAVGDLVALRRSTALLRDDALEVFYRHPDFDQPDGARVFAYCRTGGEALGTKGQVIVVANLGPTAYEHFVLPWPWAEASERGAPVSAGAIAQWWEGLDVPLGAFEVRVFVG